MGSAMFRRRTLTTSPCMGPSDASNFKIAEQDHVASFGATGNRWPLAFQKKDLCLMRGGELAR